MHPPLLDVPYMTLFRKRLFMTVFCINPDFPDDRPIPARLLRARSERPRHRHTAAEKRAPTFLCGASSDARFDTNQLQCCV